MRFFTEGLDDLTITVDAGTAHDDYPVTNLLKRDYYKQFRTESGSSTTVDIIVDLEAAKSCNYILLGDKNYDGVINIHVDAADTGGGWDTAVTSSDLAANAAHVCITFDAASKRYWKLSCATFTNETDYLGNIFIGTYYDTPHECQLNFQEIYNQGKVLKFPLANYEQRYLVQQNFHGVSYQKEYRNVVFRGLTKAEVDAFVQEFQDNCNGIEKPFYMREDDGSTYALFRFNNNQFNWQHILTDYYELGPLNIVEQI